MLETESSDFVLMTQRSASLSDYGATSDGLGSV
jgi:hypothetical protein